MEFAISSRCLSRRSLRLMASAMMAPISRTEYRAYQSENRETDELLQQTRPCTTCRRLQQLGLNLAARIVWGTDIADIALWRRHWRLPPHRHRTFAAALTEMIYGVWLPIATSLRS